MRHTRMVLLAACFFALNPAPTSRAQEDPNLVAPTGPRTPDEEKAGFHLPPGFEIQLVASDPDIHKPMNIAFDDRGRLWVTETVEYPFPAGPGKTPRDGVKILEDFGPDGRARKITTFVTGLNIPIGLMPMPGGKEALVHSIPSVDRFTDSDGDGKSDRRETVYRTFGSRDTHGMTNAFTWWFDGWIYACHGFSNSSDVKAKDGSEVKMTSGNTYRMRADGSHVEQFTHGQVNPFGLCFDRFGNLFSADCHSKPAYHLLRNAWYPSFGTVNDGLGLAPEMVTHDHGSTAISGIVYYNDTRFPIEYRGNVFIGNVVTNRINRDTVDWKGSTPKGKLEPDFLSSDDRWFRPVDIKLGPDGALYIADFYNKIIGHYEVPLTHPGRDRERGRIWRIVYKGGPNERAFPDEYLPPDTNDFTKMTPDELIAEFAGRNLTRRIFAANALVARGGDDVVRALKANMTRDHRVRAAHVLWVAERLGVLGEDALRAALSPEFGLIEVFATQIVGERPDPSPESLALVRTNLKKHPHDIVRRVSADALAKHPSAENVRPLLDARHAAKAEDEALVYVLRQAIRDQFLKAVPWPKLDDRAYSDADLRVLSDVALGAPTKDSARFLIAYLAKFPDGNGRLVEHLHHIARNGDEETDGRVLTFVHGSRPEDLPHQAELVKAVFRGLQERGAPFRGATLDWASKVTKGLLSAKDDGSIGRGIELAGMIRSPEFGDALAAIATTKDRAEATRVAAVGAMPSIDARGAVAPLGGLVIDESAPYAVREASAQALGKANRAEARSRLVEILPVAPDRLQVTIAAALCANRPGGEALLEAVAKGKASARLLQERAVRIYLDGTGVPDLAKRIEELTAGIPAADAKVAALLDGRRSGFHAAKPDTTRGQANFAKNCAACHQIGGQGARIGPQLDGIGVRGADRLIEDVLDPNRNIDVAFRQTSLALKDGRVLSGLMLREEGDVLVLADSQGKEQRISKGDVEDRKVSPVSPMPADFSDKMTEAEFYDLIAYLAANKAR